jgi:hypothetical protein
MVADCVDVLGPLHREIALLGERRHARSPLRSQHGTRTGAARLAKDDAIACAPTQRRGTAIFWLKKTDPFVNSQLMLACKRRRWDTKEVCQGHRMPRAFPPRWRLQ